MTEATTPAAPQITILDLQNVVKVIDTAAERGAFKGNELSAVGTVRDKVANFLAAIPQEEAPAEEVAPEEVVVEEVAEKPSPRRRAARA